MSLTDGQQEVKRLEEATSTFVEVMRSEQNTANVPNVGSVKTVKQRVREAVGGQFDYVEQVVSRAESVELSVAQKENSAALSAQKAKQSEENAAAVVTGGTATTTPQPGKIPLADANGKIDDGWLNAATFARSESDMMADRERNNQVYAASGYIQFGKGSGVGSNFSDVNEGLTAVYSLGNAFRTGRRKQDGYGLSESTQPVLNVAGVNITAYLGSDSIGESSYLKLPPAPKGTEVYDSDTGIVTNFESEVDPKYGDIAADINEAVSRAFEGELKNGDFRLGADYWNYNAQVVSGQLICKTDVSLSRTQPIVWDENSKYEVTVVCSEHVEGELSIIKYGVGAADGNIMVIDKAGTFTTIFDPASVLSNSGSDNLINIYNKNPVDMVIDSISVRKLSKSVVTHPVDLVGFEIFLRPINAADPFAYPLGMQQGKFTTFDGVSTVENTVRPITHFEVYPGDTTSRGRGWNLLDGSLSDPQKAKILQNPAHNIYRMNDGTLVQWTVSQRTIRGAGNGDWVNVNPSTGHLFSGVSGGLRKGVNPRGMLDSNSEFSPAAAIYLGTEADKNLASSPRQLGVFSTRFITFGGVNYKNDVAINGECYFYVIATVPRLNQGAYHPSLNPFGCSKFWRSINDSAPAFWHGSSLPISVDKDCFGTYRRSGTGTISDGNSGRPDDKRHDAIYANGLNGIIDWRKPSSDMSSPSESEKVKQKVLSGAYRGLQLLPCTKVVTQTQTASSGATAVRIPFGEAVNYQAGDMVSVYDADTMTLLVNGQLISSVGTDAGADYVSWSASVQQQVFVREAKSYCIVLTGTKGYNLSTSGNFTQSDVVGVPSNIFETEPLKNGWLGGWVPILPDGATSRFGLTRKYVGYGSDVARSYTTDSGDNWMSGDISLSHPVQNETEFTNMSSSQVNIYSYLAFAKQTKPASCKAVLSGRAGVSGVTATNGYHEIAYQALLLESLLGKVGVSSRADNPSREYGVTSLALIPKDGRLDGAGSRNPQHSALDIQAPDNSSPAVKVLPFQISLNQQCSMMFAFNELAHSGDNWGDDARMKLADFTSVYTDLNGVRLLLGCAELAIPYGFTNNHARVGEQIAGVDL